MLDKLLKAFGLLKEDVSALKESVAKLEKVHPIVKEGKPGRDGKDGDSPSVEDIVQAVVAQLPEPEKVDTKAIVDDVVAQIPKPRDGRDAPTVNVSDVAAIVLAKIEKPKDGKDGRNGPDLETVVKRVKAQVQDGEQGEPGPPGPPGKPGKDGVSVTDVQLNNNDLFVFLDGKKKKAGTIKVPTPTAPFNPGNAGGGGSARGGESQPVSGEVQYIEELRAVSEVDQNPAGTDAPINVTFGAAQGGPSDPIELGADGVISINETGLYQVRFSAQYGRTGAAGTSWLYFRTLIAFDGVNFVQVGRTVLVKLSNANEDLGTQNISTVTLQAGWKTKVEIMRGSEGNNSGGLIATDPAAPGWNPSYSAEATIQRIVWQQT